MFRFVHCADLHLDSPLRGIAAKEGAPLETIRGATRRALENLVRLCIAERVAFVIIAGDVYDGDWEDYSTGLFFQSAMIRLREQGIRVYLIRGNHDAASQISRRLTMPDNVIELPVDQPATVLLEEYMVAIHGQGFAQRAVTEDLSIHYPSPVSGYFNIGVLHTCAEGREGHEAYAPCRVDALVHKGYDYWALGHIHKREVLNERPYIVFPGNLQGRHIRETGAKGCTIVTVQGNDVTLTHQPVDVFRWFVCVVDLQEARTHADGFGAVESALALLAEEQAGYPMAVRVILTGTTELHEEWAGQQEWIENEVRGIAMLTAGERLWLEKVQVQTQPVPRPDVLRVDADVLNHLRMTMDGLANDTEFVDDFLREVKTAQQHMRAYTQMPGSLTMQVAGDIQTVLSDAEALLLAALTKAGRLG